VAAARALVVANRGDDDPGVVGQILRERGMALTVCHREDPASWPTLHNVDLVVHLGSDWSVYWPQVALSVRAELALVRAAADQSRPVLGICFGFQVVSAALGGAVFLAPSAEIGWHPVAPVGDAVPAGPWFQWHVDTVAAPPRATVHARSRVGPQAISVGRVVAVQFHPEVTDAIVARWASGDAEALHRHGVDPGALVEGTRVRAHENERQTRALMDWAAAVHARPAT
jgi:GMP synthase-like glutamine amidotransferase